MRRISLAAAGAAGGRAAPGNRSARGSDVQVPRRPGGDKGKNHDRESEWRAGAGFRRQSHRAPPSRALNDAPLRLPAMPTMRISFSAEILLDHLGRPDMRLGRIAAGLAQRAPLAQQVPALVELDLHVRQPFALVGIELALLEEP